MMRKISSEIWDGIKKIVKFGSSGHVCINSSRARHKPEGKIIKINVITTHGQKNEFWLTANISNDKVYHLKLNL